MRKTMLCLLAVALGAMCTNVNAAPSATEVAKIQAAAPAAPSAKPEKPRKVLVFSKFFGFNHTAVSYGKVAFEVLGNKTGAYTPVVSDDDAMLEPENIRQFDAIVFNDTNNEIFLPENFDKLEGEAKAKAEARDAMLKKSLVDYLKNGGGLAVIHAGVATFRKWPEFGDLVGGRFDNHPWRSGSTVTLKVDEPAHPVVAKAFPEGSFVVTDEIYQITGPYSREKQRVLLSIDTSKTDMKKDGVHRTDGDFAISWVKPYGKGRVFYNALGHEHDIYWNAQVLQHWLDGVQFVTGDLAGPVEPLK